MFIFAFSFLYAKRTPPPEVPFIIHDGYEYIADYSEGIFSGRGQILVRSVKNSKIKRRVTMYSILYIPFLERDVLWVFIKETELLDNATIRIYNENDEIFDLKLNNYTVKKIKCQQK